MRDGLVVLVVASTDPPGLIAQVAAEPAQPPGVLGGDHVGGGELLRQPRGGVARVADGGGREDEDAGAGSEVTTGSSQVRRYSRPRLIHRCDRGLTRDSRIGASPRAAGAARSRG